MTGGRVTVAQEGLAAGVPLIVAPQMQEQAMNGEQVRRLGAGMLLRRASEERLREAADLVLGASYRESARRASDELAAQTHLGRAADLVLTPGRVR